jgi:hypothetical protein
VKHLALAMAALLPAAAWAAEPKVELNAEVVFASTSGNTIDPPALMAMKQKLQQKVSYSTLRRLSATKVVVTSSSPLEIKLPNEKVATLKLEKIEQGKARIRVSVPPLVTVYTLGREGSLYQAAGQHQGGDLWLVLSATEAAKPRNAPHRATPPRPKAGS